MANNLWVIAVLALFVACTSAFEGGSGEGWPPGTKPSSTMIGVRGAIYCQRGVKLTPIQGAFAKVTCATKGKTPFTIISAPSDKKGFFMATLSQYDIVLSWNLQRDCKAYLHSSPTKLCRIATNVNKGLSGAPLKNYHTMPKQQLKVYYVGPFTFTHARVHT